MLDIMYTFFGSSLAAARQPPPANGFFGDKIEIPGMPVLPQAPLDPGFREAAKKDPFFAAFVSAHEKMLRGDP